MNEPQPTRVAAFVAELKRRHVFRILLAYGAVAFVVLQAAEIILPAFGMGDWALQLIVVVSVLGLPVVLALAWVYEITPRGIRTMKELDLEAGRKLEEEGSFAPRLALLAVTLFAAGTAGLYWVRTSVPTDLGTTDPAAGAASPAFRSADDAARDVPVRSLAVLPLESFSPPAEGEAGAAEGDYFAAGMHEALVSRLSRMGSPFRVISRTTVSQYDPTGRSIAQIGEDLGVEGIVEGSVVVDGGRVRITVQLIHAPSDTHLWSADYERELEDIIALQREVATAIADEILGELGDDETEPERVASTVAVPETDPDAAMAEMKGRVLLSAADEASVEELDAAQAHFEEALREDSSYAPALVGWAGSTLMRELAAGRTPSPEALARVGRQARRALQVDPENGEAMDILVVLDEMDFVDLDDLEDLAGFDFRVTDSVAPTPPVAPPVAIRGAAGGPVTTDLGARIRALGIERANVVSVPVAKVAGARGLIAVGRTDQARDMLEDVLAEHPGHGPAWDEMERLLAVTGRVEDIVDLRRRRGELAGEARVRGAPGPGALARAVEEDGAEGYWTWRLEELEARRRAGAEVRHLDVATAHAALGHTDEAFAELRAAVEQGEPELLGLRSDPTWDRYRRDPRFRSLLGRVVERRPRGPD